MPFAVGICLKEHGSRGKLGGISSYGKGGVGVGELKYGLGEEKPFQLVE